ncbi:MAG: hypothetical protein A4E69_03376 [Syntrophus sp. PtaB.Bin138]|nr:MAG: hypothetical protein A4E69_03376 [Syntrophus sp. PtaB.Bin138]
MNGIITAQPTQKHGFHALVRYSKILEGDFAAFQPFV